MKQYKKIKTRRGTIVGRNISHLALLGLFLILGVSFMSGQMLYRRNLKLYTENTYSYAHLIADNISTVIKYSSSVTTRVSGREILL